MRRKIHIAIIAAGRAISDIVVVANNWITDGGDQMVTDSGDTLVFNG